jgi:K+-sensing histidine kinase KdpD
LLFACFFLCLFVFGWIYCLCLFCFASLIAHAVSLFTYFFESFKTKANENETKQDENDHKRTKTIKHVNKQYNKNKNYQKRIKTKNQRIRKRKPLLAIIFLNIVFATEQFVLRTRRRFEFMCCGTL